MFLAHTTGTRAAAAVATAATLTVASFVAPASAAAQDSETQPRITSGTVQWPIKASYLDYIQGFAEGRILTSQGVVPLKNGKQKVTNLRFPVNAEKSHVDGNGNGVIQLDGELQFYGHMSIPVEGKWGLDLNYKDFKIVVTNGTDAKITADYHVQGGLPNEEPKNEKVDDAELTRFTLPKKISGGTYRARVESMTLSDGGYNSLLAYNQNLEFQDAPLNITLNSAGQTAGSSGSSSESSADAGDATSSVEDFDAKLAELSSTEKGSLLERIITGVAILLAVSGLTVALAGIAKGMGDILGFQPPKLPPLPF